MAVQFGRFLLVGGGAFVGYVAAQAAMVELLGSSVLAATAVAFVVGTIISYAGNALWSFNAAPTWQNMMRFVAVTAVGLALNLAIAAVLDAWGLHYVLIAVIIFTVVPAINFLGHRYFSFRAHEAA